MLNMDPPPSSAHVNGTANPQGSFLFIMCVSPTVSRRIPGPAGLTSLKLVGGERATCHVQSSGA